MSNAQTMKENHEIGGGYMGLVQQDSRLYLSQFEQFDNVVHLALHRFKRAEVADFPAVRPKDFDLHGYVNDRNGAWIH